MRLPRSITSGYGRAQAQVSTNTGKPRSSVLKQQERDTGSSQQTTSFQQRQQQATSINQNHDRQPRELTSERPARRNKPLDTQDRYEEVEEPGEQCPPLTLERAKRPSETEMYRRNTQRGRSSHWEMYDREPLHELHQTAKLAQVSHNTPVFIVRAEQRGSPPPDPKKCSRSAKLATSRSGDDDGPGVRLATLFRCEPWPARRHRGLQLGSSTARS